MLRYLASTLSNAEIAAELYLSVNTVKTHQRMIYRKLGADGRRDAVRRAKQLADPLTGPSSADCSADLRPTRSRAQSTNQTSARSTAASP